MKPSASTAGVGAVDKVPGAEERVQRCPHELRAGRVLAVRHERVDQLELLAVAP